MSATRITSSREPTNGMKSGIRSTGLARYAADGPERHLGGPRHTRVSEKTPAAPLSPAWPRGARLSGPARASPLTWLAALSRVVIRELLRARAGGHPGVGG